MTLPRRAWVLLNHIHTGIGRFRSCLCIWGMASSVACECGAEEQTVDHVVLQCPIHRPPHGLHGLMVLDDKTIEWLLNTCPEIYRGQAVDKRTHSNERRRRACTRVIYSRAGFTQSLLAWLTGKPTCTNSFCPNWSRLP